MAVVERMSHRVAVMYLGQIVEIGPRRAVFNDPAASLHAHACCPRCRLPILRGAAGERSYHRKKSRAPSATSATSRGVEPLREVGPGHFVAVHPVGAY